MKIIKSILLITLLLIINSCGNDDNISTIEPTEEVEQFICPEIDVEMHSLEDVHRYIMNYKNCKIINGSLTISGITNNHDEINNLEFLKNLETIKGDLTISNIHFLVNLDELVNLITVDGAININNNPNLKTINGFTWI